MKHVRHNRKALAPLRGVLGRPGVHEWTGNKVFNRTKGARFRLLCNLLRDDHFESFCAAIGFIEVNWAMFEMQLDRWVQIVFVTLHDRSISNEAPTSYSRKSDYLRRAFNRLPALSQYKQDAIEILAKGDRLADTRHKMTHAVVTHMKPRNGKYELVNRKLRRDGSHIIEDVIFDPRGFPDLSKDLGLLGRDAILLSGRLGDRFLEPNV